MLLSHDLVQVAGTQASGERRLTFQAVGSRSAKQIVGHAVILLAHPAIKHNSMGRHALRADRFGWFVCGGGGPDGGHFSSSSVFVAFGAAEVDVAEPVVESAEDPGVVCGGDAAL